MSEREQRAMRFCGNANCKIRLQRHDCDNWIVGRGIVRTVVCSQECSRIVASQLDLMETARELRAEVERLTAWRIAYEELTPSGSEYVNDLDRCREYVQRRLLDGHEAKKQVVRLRRQLEGNAKTL